MPEVPPSCSLLVAAETAAAMLRARALCPSFGPWRQLSADELRTLEAIDAFGRSMRPDVLPVAVGDCDDAA
jgi:hypothetical protein